MCTHRGMCGIAHRYPDCYYCLYVFPFLLVRFSFVVHIQEVLHFCATLFYQQQHVNIWKMNRFSCSLAMCIHVEMWDVCYCFLILWVLVWLPCFFTCAVRVVVFLAVHIQEVLHLLATFSSMKLLNRYKQIKNVTAHLLCV